MTNEQLALLLDGLRDKLATRIEAVHAELEAFLPDEAYERTLEHVEPSCTGWLCMDPAHRHYVRTGRIHALRPLNAMVDDLDRQAASLRVGENGSHAG